MSERKRMDHFDGLRAYAMLLIIASHTEAFHFSVGGIIVALFLVLSGFFAARPGEQRFFELEYLRPVNWLRYYALKIVRMIPVYWLVLLVVYAADLFKGVSATPSVLLENMFLINANGHLWYVQNQMVIYLFVPALLLLSCAIRKPLKEKGNVIGGILLVAAGVGLQFWLRLSKPILLMGNGKGQYLRLGLFVIGLGFGTLMKAAGSRRITRPAAKAAADILILLLLVSCAFAAPEYLKLIGMKLKTGLGWKYPEWCGLGLGLLVVLLYLNSEGLMARLLSIRPLRIIGEASFSMYLVQSFYIRALKALPSKEIKWMLVCLTAAGVAVMSWQLFEKPLYQAVRRWLYPAKTPGT